MDDRTFDEQTARQWIRTIESGTNPVREQDLYPRLRSWVETASLARVLEIGCGQGDCARKLDHAGRTYIGIDPSPFLIERAKELCVTENRQFQLGNAYALPFADRQFDGVFSVLVWHLLSDIQRAARELGRVLKRSGHFLIITANPDAYAEWMSLYVNTRIEGRRFEGDMLREGTIVDHDVLHFHTLEEITSSLKLAHFQVGSVEPFRRSRLGAGREYLIAIQGKLPV